MPTDEAARAAFEEHYGGGDRRWLLVGMFPIECRNVECERYDDCAGWKMTTTLQLANDVELYGNTPDEVAEALRHRDELMSGGGA
jgi:hypothetical protein